MMMSITRARVTSSSKERLVMVWLKARRRGRSMAM